MIHLDDHLLFKRLENSQSILISGAGGGFDIYSGLPIILLLLKKGLKVTVSNYSFTWLMETSSVEIFPNCYEIKEADYDKSGRNYFPERILKSWFTTKGFDINIYAFNRVGVQPLKEAYNYLIKEYSIDTVILVDGGTDSLMFGDEEGLGTPQEDSCSIVAVNESCCNHNYLTCLGFGVDDFHGVSHYRFLENVSRCIVNDAFLGTIHLLATMKEAMEYDDLVNFANKRMKGKESIVSTSISSSLKGNYGDYQVSKRTQGSELWINPLMTLYWNFDLDYIASELKYYDHIKESKTIGEVNNGILKFRNSLKIIRESKKIPL